MYTILLTLAPIWFPHWPACRWTISLIVNVWYLLNKKIQNQNTWTWTSFQIKFDYLFSNFMRALNKITNKKNFYRIKAKLWKKNQKKSKYSISIAKNSNGMRAIPYKTMCSKTKQRIKKIEEKSNELKSIAHNQFTLRIKSICFTFSDAFYVSAVDVDVVVAAVLGIFFFFLCLYLTRCCFCWFLVVDFVERKITTDRRQSSN